jgi:hypothetical protein
MNCKGWLLNEILDGYVRLLRSIGCLCQHYIYDGVMGR